MTEVMHRLRAHIHPVVFPVSAGLIIAFVLFGTIVPEIAEVWLGETLTFITGNFAWFLITSVTALLVICVFLIIGPYAKVRLGPDDSRPDYSYLTWFAMLFSAGMGIGLLFWGVAEPIWHFVDAPRFESGTPAAARDAMLLSFHHWGLGPWAIYAVLGLSLGYFGFRHGLPMTVRSSLYPLIGDRIHGWMGNTVDILAILGTMFGVATSLGLGVLQVNAGLSRVFGAPTAVWVQLVLIAAITLVATISVFTGLDRGIRRLSEVNINLATLLLLFVALAGPTVLLIGAYFENLGQYVFNFVDVLFWTGTYDAGEAGWLGGWTIFYWAWWISWSPFVGMFIARISRGRTIREFVLGVLLVPSLVSFLWFTVMGNTALSLELADVGGIAQATTGEEGDTSFALFALLENFPFTAVTSVLALVVIIAFFVTSSDSGSFVIDMIASGGNLDPPRSQRIFWAVSEGLVAAALLLAGGLAALQAGAVSSGLPFTLVLLIVAIGLLKGLRAERAGVRLVDLPGQPLIAATDPDIDVPGAAHEQARDDPPVEEQDRVSSNRPPDDPGTPGSP